MKHILIATDGSRGGSAAVDAGLELAQAAGAAVSVVYVRHPIELLGEPFYQRKLSGQLDEARRALDVALAAADTHGVRAGAEILEGEASEEILRLAQARAVDLVVVGSRGLGEVTGALLGSVSRAVVHGADRPVLVVKEPEPAGLGTPTDAQRLRSI